MIKRVFYLTVILFATINLHAQTDSLALFRRLNANPNLDSIDLLLGIPATYKASDIEYRKYRQVTKMDDPRYLFECDIILWDGQAWIARVYGIVYTSSKTSPIYRYQKELGVAKGIDSLKMKINKAIVSKPQREKFKGYLSYPPAIKFYHDGATTILVPQVASSTYTKDPATPIIRLTYKRFSQLERLFNRMLIE